METAEKDRSHAIQEQRLLLLQQVLASRTFAKATRLSQFLQFIGTKALEGRTDEINEQQIGIHVFGRTPTYSPSDDSVVRTQARLLRQRIEEYFEHECPTSEWILSIPKGGYVPVFSPRHAALAPAVAASSTVVEAAPREASPAGEDREDTKDVVAQPPALGPRPALPRPAMLWAAASALTIVLVVAGLFVSHVTPWPFTPRVPEADLFWKMVFHAGRPVVLVPSDDGLILSQEFRKAPVDLEQYLKGSYLQQAAAPQEDKGMHPPLTAQWLAAHQYTSTADLSLAIRISRLPEAAGVDVESRYARVLQLDDMKHANVILIGGVAANPWVSLFSGKLDFDVNYDWQNARGYVIDRHPSAGKPEQYVEASENGAETSYGVLALLPGLTGEGCALLFEGSGMAGTEAAADFPFSGKQFSRFLGQLGRNADGTIPYFEVLLKTRSLQGNAPEERVLDWRVLQSDR